VFTSEVQKINYQDKTHGISQGKSPCFLCCFSCRCIRSGCRCIRSGRQSSP